MPDPSPPMEPTSAESQTTQPALGRTKLFDLEPRIASFICYIPVCPVNLIFGGMFLVTEPKESRYVRFHAMQSLILGGGYFVISILCWILSFVFGIVPFLGFLAGIISLFSMLISFVYIGFSIKCMIDAHRGKDTKLLFIGDIAEQFI
ncbi:MAG TPA: hypothetical protein V6D17_11630 [Candidatus Obscuribacterales bacterium]